MTIISELRQRRTKFEFAKIAEILSKPKTFPKNDSRKRSQNKDTSNGKKIVSISGNVDELLNEYLDTIPYFDNWTYYDGTTINYSNVQRTYYTRNTL